jgi:chemotaxis signal transduction protein
VTISDAVGRRVETLRRDFDAGFAKEPSGAIVETCDVLAIRVAGEPYAILVEDISELAQGRKIVPLPSRRPDVMGVAAIRGTLVSVHGLASLLGHGSDDARVSWLAVCLRAEGIALAFGRLERLHRVRTGEVSRGDGSSVVQGAVRIDGQSRPIVNVRSIVGTIDGKRPTVEGA